jgi:hypothetical protein
MGDIGNSNEESEVIIERTNSNYIDLVQETEDKPVSLNNVFVFLSLLSGIGNGCAMMPIFNHEVRALEDFDIDIHKNDILFAISTINTLLVYSILITKNSYQCLENVSHLQKIDEKLTISSFILASLSSIPQVSMLWNIELHNREIDHSTDFDKFIAYALFSSIPLFCYQTLKSYTTLQNAILNYQNHNLSEYPNTSIQQTVYIVSAFTLVANEMIYLHTANELTEDYNETIKNLFLTAASIGAIAMTYCEFISLKKVLTEKQEHNNDSTFQKVQKSILSIESVWFTLPLISVCAKVSKDYFSNSLSAIICLAKLISHSIFNRKIV